MSACPEVARRAVACKGWRWMPGMRTTDEDDGHGVLLCPVKWMWAWHDEHAYWHKVTRDVARDIEPDLDDPATLGCLLELVREAWGDDYSVRLHFGDGVDIFRADGSMAWSMAGGAEALVAALEAAP